MQKQFFKNVNKIKRGLAGTIPAALIFVSMLFLTGCSVDNPKPDVPGPSAIPSGITDAGVKSEDDGVPVITDDDLMNERSENLKEAEDDEPVNITLPPEPTHAPEVGLYINEILATNDSFADTHGRYSDMIEIYNASDKPVKLSDYYLSDSKKHFADYPMPDTELEPGGYFVLNCMGKYECEYDDDLAFGLSYFGEKIYIFDGEGNIVDRVEYPEMPKDISYGRNGEGEYKVYDGFSFEKANEGGYAAIADVPGVNTEPGFYRGTQLVSFTGGGAVRYTTDGSKPDNSSKLWDGSPIVVSSTCAIRAYRIEDGCLDSFDVAYNYYIDEPDYELDVLMLSMDDYDFDTMSRNYSSNCKYPANIAMYSNGKKEFDIDCAVGVFGCTSREYDKKSYKVKFTTDYGPSKLRYRLFDDSDIDEFNSLVLRSGSQDNEGPLLRDEYISSLVTSDGELTEVLVMNYRPVNLYINDEYRGIYYIREHEDEDMVASHYGCDPEEVTIIEQASEVKCGHAAKEWTDMWAYLKNNHLDSAEAYEYVKSVVSLESVADYYIIELWTGNIDMDNVREFKAGDDKWRYALFDLDLSLTRPEEGSVSRMIGKFNSGLYTFNALIYRLLENDEFVGLFCERLAKFANGVLSDEVALKHLDDMEARLEHDMQYNCELWGNVKDSSKKVSYRTFNGWKSSVKYLRNLVEGRAALLVKDIVENKDIDEDTVREYLYDFVN